MQQISSKIIYNDNNRYILGVLLIYDTCKINIIVDTFNAPWPVSKTALQHGAVFADLLCMR